MTVEEVAKENAAIAKEYKDLLKISYRRLSAQDKKLIRKAFDVAVDAHSDQRRKSGEAYIFHPIAVAKIVASEIGLDAHLLQRHFFMTSLKIAHVIRLKIFNNYLAKLWLEL